MKKIIYLIILMLSLSSLIYAQERRHKRMDGHKKIDQLDGSIIIIGNIKINEKYKTVPVKLDIKAVINYYKNKSSNNYEQLKPKYLKKTEAEEKL